MVTQTPTKAQQDIEELYNSLMWNIEPELTTWVLPDLEFLYPGESNEDRKARFAWYAAAFGLFMDTYKEFVSTCKGHLHGIQKELSALSEVQSGTEDTKRMTAIEQSF